MLTHGLKTRSKTKKNKTKLFELLRQIPTSDHNLGVVKERRLQLNIEILIIAKFGQKQ